MSYASPTLNNLRPARLHPGQLFAVYDSHIQPLYFDSFFMSYERDVEKGRREEDEEGEGNEK